MKSSYAKNAKTLSPPSRKIAVLVFHTERSRPLKVNKAQLFPRQVNSDMICCDEQHTSTVYACLFFQVFLPTDVSPGSDAQTRPVPFASLSTQAKRWYSLGVHRAILPTRPRIF